MFMPRQLCACNFSKNRALSLWDFTIPLVSIRSNRMRAERKQERKIMARGFAQHCSQLSRGPKISFCVLIILVKTILLPAPCSRGCFPFLKTPLFNESELKSSTMKPFFAVERPISKGYAQQHTPVPQLRVLTSTYLLLSKFWTFPLPHLLSLPFVYALEQKNFHKSSWSTACIYLILISNHALLAATGVLLNSYPPCAQKKSF